MKIERAGITFEVTYIGGTRGNRETPPEDPYTEVGSSFVSDWDELAACHGINSGAFLSGVTLDDIIEKVAEREIDSITKEIEQSARDDFDPPDDSDWDDYGA